MNNVKYIYSIGGVTTRVKSYADNINIPCKECFTLNSALEEIKKDMESGEIVLLSTASSSQDQYVRFEDRGQEFKKFVNK